MKNRFFATALVATSLVSLSACVTDPNTGERKVSRTAIGTAPRPCQPHHANDGSVGWAHPCTGRDRGAIVMRRGGGIGTQRGARGHLQRAADGHLD